MQMKGNVKRQKTRGSSSIEDSVILFEVDARHLNGSSLRAIEGERLRQSHGMALLES